MTVADITLARLMSVTDINYDFSVSRWEPNAKDRLQRSAMKLYARRGYDETTVAEIAQAAGLSERTFFRHFSDKREVLFAGSSELVALMVKAIDTAPAETSPMGAVALALAAAGTMFDERLALARVRQAIIEAHSELQERELIKLAYLATSLTQALTRRGVPLSAASLSAEAGMAVFRLGFERWVHAPQASSLSRLYVELLGELRAVVVE